MKVAFRLALVVVSTAVLYRGLFTQLRVAHVAADVFLLLAVVAGLTGGPERGAAMGFLAGLSFDLLLQSPLGLTALAYCIVGFAAGRYQLSVVRSSRRRLMLTTGIASALGYGFYIVVGSVLGQHMARDHIGTYIGVVALFNAVLAPLAARALRWAWDDTSRPAVYPTRAT